LSSCGCVGRLNPEWQDAPAAGQALETGEELWPREEMRQDIVEGHGKPFLGHRSQEYMRKWAYTLIKQPFRCQQVFVASAARLHYLPPHLPPPLQPRNSSEHPRRHRPDDVSRPSAWRCSALTCSAIRCVTPWIPSCAIGPEMCPAPRHDRRARVMLRIHRRCPVACRSASNRRSIGAPSWAARCACRWANSYCWFWK
jgi:hypothetical protein